MSNLKENFNKIVEDLDNKIENKKDLEYIKSQIYNLSIIFMDELDKISELNLDKMNKIIEKHKELVNRMQNLEEKMDKLQKDIYIEDDEDINFEIICPYCNTEFEVDMSDEIKNEVICPECENRIELDWNGEDEGCSGNCHGCHGCSDEYNENNLEDDDM